MASYPTKASIARLGERGPKGDDFLGKVPMVVGQISDCGTASGGCDGKRRQ